MVDLLLTGVKVGGSGDGTSDICLFTCNTFLSAFAIGPPAFSGISGIGELAGEELIVCGIEVNRHPVAPSGESGRMGTSCGDGVFELLEPHCDQLKLPIF